MASSAIKFIVEVLCGVGFVLIGVPIIILHICHMIYVLVAFHVFKYALGFTHIMAIKCGWAKLEIKDGEPVIKYFPKEK